MADPSGVGRITWRGRRVKAAGYVNRIINDFRRGRTSVEELVQICNSYVGPEPYLLFESPHQHHEVFVRFLRRVPDEEKMLAFLQSLVNECPGIRTAHAHLSGTTLLHLALEHTGCRSMHLLLAVPENVRLVDRRRKMPLHVACESSHAVDPSVIHRLMDLDASVLTFPDLLHRVPLHYALGQQRQLPVSCVQRMIDVRPDALYCRDYIGRTPLDNAIVALPPAPPATALLLQEIVRQHPRSVAIPETTIELDSEFVSSLLWLCHVYGANRRPELIRAVVMAHPPALIFPGRGRTMMATAGPIVCLPFEAVAASNNGGVEEEEEEDETVAYVWNETIFMAFAVVEYVLGLDVAALVDGGEVDTANIVVWFQGHVKEALHDLFPQLPVEEESGFSVAQELLRRSRVEDTDGSRSSKNDVMVALLRALFCQQQPHTLLRGEARLLRSVILRETVVDLYQMNRLGRRRGGGGDANVTDSDDSSVAAALHQIELLASLRDSTTVESTYLQFRQVSHRLLLVHGRNGHGGTTAVAVGGGVPNEHRKRPARGDAGSTHDGCPTIPSSKRPSRSIDRLH